jgi:hypothetical protein
MTEGMWSNGNKSGTDYCQISKIFQTLKLNLIIDEEIEQEVFDLEIVSFD